MTEDQLKEIFPEIPAKRISRYFPGLSRVMKCYDITGPLREAAFIAQVAHESGLFKYKEELATGDAYEGRKDLGNTKSGDGRRFKGHGFIQVTGRANHLAFADYYGFTLDDAVEYLQSDEGACMSAGWFWNKKNLNELADTGDFKKITKRINGGYNGLTERLLYYTRALKVLEA